MWPCEGPCLCPTWPLFFCWGTGELRNVSTALVYSLGTQSSRKLSSDQREQGSQPVRVSSQGRGVSCLSQARAAGLRAALLGMTECHLPEIPTSHHPPGPKTSELSSWRGNRRTYHARNTMDGFLRWGQPWL